jgi:hypothetical protein
MLKHVLVPVAAALVLVAVPGIACAHVQRVAVERGSVWMHAAGRWLLYGLLAVSPVPYKFVAARLLGWNGLSFVELAVPAVLAFLPLSLMLGGEEKYRAGRELYIVHEDDEEHWTDVWARHGSAWRDRRDEN